MAGVGIELNKILARGGYVSLLRAYSYAALIGSGPWLVSVVALGVLGVILTGRGLEEEVQVFLVAISYCYALTLVFTGPIQMVLTRHASDLIYAERREKIFPAFAFALAWTMLIFSALGLVIFVGFVPGPLAFRLAAAAMMSIVSGIWIASIFLTAIKNYHKVLFAFICGCAMSFLATLGMESVWGISGAMIGFTLGHALLLLLLCAAIFQETGGHTLDGSELLGSFNQYQDLALAGLFYNLGIWIDKFLFWWIDPAADHVAGILRAAPVYDRVVYFSFLTIVPGMAVFLLKLETEFSIANENFFDHVLKKGTLAQIIVAKNAMVSALRDGLGLLLKVQGLFTALLILGAERTLQLLGLGAVQAGIFRIALLGTFMLVMFLGLLMVLHYLDKRRDAMWCCAVFAAVNGLFTALSILAGERWFGYGFLFAAAAGMVMAALFVNHHLHNLERDTFTQQSVYG